MCDTIGTRGAHGAYFAKNSDRSPNEPQTVELHAAKVHHENTLKATYISIDQSKETRAVLISRPAWMWGAEMGVNDCGVAIGNEAVFTKGSYAKTGLTGMDLLRLGLERSMSARQALGVITELLERYGQGGNCGFDHEFYYDNSFLIMDKKELFVLETHDRQWVYRQAASDCISNRLCIGTDGTAYSRERCDFKKIHSDPLFTYFSGSKQRRDLVQKQLRENSDTGSLMRILRSHEENMLDPLVKGSVKSPCMHAGGLIGDHTTQSMVIDFCGTAPVIWTTGCSTPCISLYKPYLFGNKPVPPIFLENDQNAKTYWLRREQFHRNVLSRILPPEYYAQRNALESEWINLSQSIKHDPAAMLELSVKAAKEESEFFDVWERRLPSEKIGKQGFKTYWKKKNAALEHA